MKSLVLLDILIYGRARSRAENILPADTAIYASQLDGIRRREEHEGNELSEPCSESFSIEDLPKHLRERAMLRPQAETLVDKAI